MPEYLAPGVFVEEARHGRGTIDSAGTSTTAFVGATRKGPAHTPTVVRSFAEYQSRFGPADSKSIVSIAVWHYFSNGGRTAVVVNTPRTSGKGSAHVAAADLTGRESDNTGIFALEGSLSGLPPSNILVIPDMAALSAREHASAAKTILAFCEEHRAFFIIDPPAPRSSRRVLTQILDWAKRSDAIRHPNAAVYFPRIACADPLGKSGAESGTMVAPASGAIAGLYARTDQRGGVWKAPAGIDARLLGADDVEIALSDAQIGELHGVSINGIRALPRRGVLAWGARTFVGDAANQQWKYVNVRRLLLFIEESLYDGLGWSVFEPNGVSLWAQIRLAVSSFMNHLWQAGALLGPSTREAYFVKCGYDTMSQADIEDGRVNLLIGVAPTKPAEFVVLKIELHTADAD